MAAIITTKRAPLADVPAQIAEHEALYQRLITGKKPPANEFLNLPSLSELKDKLRIVPSSQRPAFDEAAYREREKTLRVYVIGELLKPVLQAQDDIEKTRAYTSVTMALKKFQMSPRDYVSLVQEESGREQQAEIFSSGAKTYVRTNLRHLFSKVSLYPDDIVLLKTENASRSDRLNALFRPVEEKLALRLLGVLEEAFAAAADNIDLEDCVAELIPENVFTPPVKKADVRLPDPAEMAQRRDINTALRNVLHSQTPEEKSDAYAAVLQTMNAHRLKREKCLGWYPEGDAQQAAQEAFSSGALAYVNTHLLNIFIRDNARPSKEDDAVIRSADAVPIDKLNALFRTAGKKAIMLLTVLEDAGFDLEEEGLVEKILAAGQPPASAAPSGPAASPL